MVNYSLKLGFNRFTYFLGNAPARRIPNTLIWERAFCIW